MIGDIEITNDRTQNQSIIPDMITVAELQQLFGIGRDTAYNLVRRKDFPSIKLGGEYRVFTGELGGWLIKQKKNK